MLAAVAISAEILLLGRFAPQGDIRRLTVVQLATCALICVPRLRVVALTPDITAAPVKARTRATLAERDGDRRVRPQATTGTRGTYRAVRNAEVEALIVSNSIVCNPFPAASAAPIRVPPTTSARVNRTNKRRPAVIVSNDRANSVAAQLGRGVVTVVPVTSSTDRIFPFQALLPAATTGLQQDSKAHAEQVRSIAVERLGAVLGRAPADAMVQLDDALRLHLQL